MRTAMQFAYGICFRSVGCCCLIRRFECIRRSPGWWTALSGLLTHRLTSTEVQAPRQRSALRMQHASAGAVCQPTLGWPRLAELRRVSAALY